VSDTNGLTTDPPDFDSLGISARRAVEQMRDGFARIAAALADSLRPGLTAVAHELGFRARARVSGERLCPANRMHADVADQPHFALTGKCPTCGAEV
jgi:hypothetical protein